MTTVTIPKLTLTMEGGTLVRWLRNEGQRVEKDEPLFELETDKALTEVTAPVSGILHQILVREGTVTCGAAIATIAGDMNDPPEPQVEVLPVPATAPIPGPTERHPKERSVRMTHVSPAARRRARELGADISSLQGSGPDGRVTQQDVEDAARRGAAPPSSPRLRALISERVSKAWHTVPHIHIGGELRAEGIVAALDRARRERGPEIGITDLLLFATASTLRKFLAINSVWLSGRSEVQEDINLALAVQTDAGVVTPVIRDTDHLTLLQLSIQRREVVARARERRLAPSELEGGSFTLTNLGMYPVDFFVPIVNYPQSAILASGRLRDRSLESRLGPVQRIWINLAVDHRVADGATAAEFLKELEHRFDALQNFV
jgi:pyruvate dehydrogenase E2 component (dihydrolipoamide acetyltransferase)